MSEEQQQPPVLEVVAEPPPPPALSVPPVGMPVTYRDENGVVSAAVVTGVNDDGTVALHVTYRTGIAGHADVDSAAQSDGSAPGYEPLR